MPILTALPGIRPSLRSFSMDEWPQGSAKMRGGRSMRWAQVSAPAGARMELSWENINYAQAELISAAWDANYGTYGNLQLAGETLAGLVALSGSILVTLSGDPITTLAGDLITTDAAIGGSGLADLIEQPFPDAIWRFEGPPVVEAVKAGRCTVRLLLRTRRDLRPDAILPGPATPLTTPFIVVPASVIRTRALAPEVVGTLIGASAEVPTLEAITVSLLAPEVVGSAFFSAGVDVPAITVTVTALAPEVVGSVVPSSVDVPSTTVTVTALAPEVVGSPTGPESDWSLEGIQTNIRLGNSGATFDYSIPAAAQENDLLIAAIAHRSNCVWTAPAGWEVGVQQSLGDSVTGDSGIASLAIFYAIRGASNPDVMFTRAGTFGDTMAGLAVFRPSNGRPDFVAGQITTEVADANGYFYLPGFTTGSADHLIIAAGSGGRTNTRCQEFTALTDPTANPATTLNAALGNIAKDSWAGRVIIGFNGFTSPFGELDVGRAVKSTAGPTGQLRARNFNNNQGTHQSSFGALVFRPVPLS